MLLAMHCVCGQFTELPIVKNRKLKDSINIQETIIIGLKKTSATMTLIMPLSGWAGGCRFS
jgi:hypothetical protein